MDRRQRPLHNVESPQEDSKHSHNHGRQRDKDLQNYEAVVRDGKQRMRQTFRNLFDVSNAESIKQKADLTAKRGERGNTMKRYSMCYESDEVICRSTNHHYGYASTLKTAKQYISKVRKNEADRNPRNFRIYDHWADIDPLTGFVPCVYHEY